jgi:sortase (surface protein transpeptidase)
MPRILGQANGGRRGLLTVSALAATVAGLVLGVVALATQQPSPPEPPPETAVEPAPSSAGTTTAPGSPAAEAGGTDKSAEDPLPASPPVSISIPKIEVDSPVLALGKAPDGSLAVPQPGPDLDKAAWYENSPTPGQPGPAIIEGHVATEQGPSVFFDLGDLRRGDRVEVTREDGRVVTFTVRRLETFPKDRFPTQRVYGGGDLGTPTLRLITCSNFDQAVGNHTDNLIAFAVMTDVRQQ